MVKGINFWLGGKIKIPPTELELEARSKDDIVILHTEEVGDPSDGKPVHFATGRCCGSSFPIKGQVEFKSTVTLKDGRRFATHHIGVSGHPPSEEFLLQAWENADALFWTREHSLPNTGNQRNSVAP